MSIKLSYLEAFAVVAETGSISEAAKRMGLSQPSLSRQVQMLEAALGLSLCLRDHRGVELTDDGRRFHQSLAPLLQQFRSLVEDATAESIAGTITLGTLEGVGQSTVMRLVLGFRRLHPGVSFHVEYLEEFEIIERLRAGRLDFGILTRGPAAEACEALRLLDERLVAVTRERNELTLEDALAARRARFVGYRPDDPLLRAFLDETVGHERSRDLQVALAVNSQHSMMEALGSFDSYAVMPWRSVRRAVESRVLRIASPKELSGSLYLAWPKGRPSKRRHRLFREHLLAAAQSET